VNRIRSRKIKYSTTCLVSVLRAFAILAAAAQQDVVLLGPNGAPGSEGKTAPEKVRLTPDGEHIISSVDRPSITVYLPPKETATGAAVGIAPGGSHVELWVEQEGYAVAGLVLKYRLAQEAGSSDTVEGDSIRCPICSAASLWCAAAWRNGVWTRRALA